MQGNVISFQKETNSGLISGHDGQRYSFNFLDWENKNISPKIGSRVDFEIEEKAAKQIIVLKNNSGKNSKRKTAAALWAFFLGGLGAHKFYLGQTGMGFLYILTCWTFIPSIVAFIEFIIYLTMSEDQFDEKYNS